MSIRYTQENDSHFLSRIMRAREFIRHIFFFPFFRWEYGKWEILRREMQSDFLSNLSSMRRRSRSVREDKKECTTEVYGEKLSWSSWMSAVRNNRKILSLLRIYYTMLSFKSIYSFFLPAHPQRTATTHPSHALSRPYESGWVILLLTLLFISLDRTVKNIKSHPRLND